MMTSHLKIVMILLNKIPYLNDDFLWIFMGMLIVIFDVLRGLKFVFDILEMFLVALTLLGKKISFPCLFCKA